MARPKSNTPTPAELRILQVIWDDGPATVREVIDRLDPSGERAYTTIMSLMNVMADKKLLKRKRDGRAFIYDAKEQRDRTLGRMVNDMLGRAFQGSTSAMVAHLLQNASPDQDELARIRETIESYQSEDGDKASSNGNGRKLA